MAIGTGANAFNAQDLAIGNTAKAEGGRSVAIGYQAISNGESGVALGRDALSNGAYGIAIGYQAQTVYSSGVALGYKAKANLYGIAQGSEAEAGEYGVALGQTAKANRYGIAQGDGANAAGFGSLALGRGALAEQDYALASGYEAHALGGNSIATGYQAQAQANYSIAEGYQAQAIGVLSHASGYQAQASGQGAIADGFQANAFGTDAVAMGSMSKALGNQSVALGQSATVEADMSVALGNGAKVYQLANNGMALGAGSVANAINSVALGASSVADRDNSVSVGMVGFERQITNVAAGATLTDAVNVAQLQAAVANIPVVNFVSVQGNPTDGNYNNNGASGLNAIAIGANALASGDYAIAEGDGASAKGKDSVAIGHGAQTADYASISIGNQSGSAQTGNRNTSVGEFAGKNAAGNGNVMLGRSAGFAANGNFNVMSGYSAGNGAVGNRNVISGNFAGYDAKGSDNVMLGSDAGNAIGGQHNVVLGTSSGEMASGNSNVALGHFAAQNLMGNHNVVTGAAAGHLAAGDNNVMTGNGSGVGLEGDNNVALGTMANSYYRRDAQDQYWIGRDGSTYSSLPLPMGYVNASNTVAIGNDTLAVVDGGVALGSGAIADTAAGQAGYLANGQSDAMWQATLAAVSVGGKDSAGKVQTRQITNVAAGKTLTDAVNVAQLQAATLGLAPLAQTAVVYDSTAKNQVTLGGVGAAPVKLTNLQAAVLDPGSKDAVTGAQLYATSQTQAAQGNAIAQNSLDIGKQATTLASHGTQLSQQANTLNSHANSIGHLEQGWSLSSNGGAATAIKAGDGVNFVNGQNIAISQAGNSISIATTANALFSQVTVGGVVISGNGIDAGGKIISNLGSGAVNATSNDAITGAQLYQAMQAGGSNSGVIAQLQQGFALQVDGVQAQQVKAGDSVNLQSSKNVKVSQTGTGIEVALADDIQVNSVQVGSVVISQSGINAGGNVIGNVADGVLNSDAANMGQLRDLQASFNVQAEKQKYMQVNASMGAPVAYASGSNATAIGVGSQASGSNAISVGSGSNVLGNDSLSVGTGNVVSGSRSGAIGDPNIISGNDSYAIGNDNTIAANKSFVLGNNVTIASSANDMSKANGATFQGSVALGDSSTVAAAVGTTSTQIRGETYNFAGSKPVGTVSVGGKNAERTITNVAAGRLDASSTDAVNGSQLFATNQAVEKLQAGTAGVVQYAGAADKNGVNNHAKLVSGDDKVAVRLSNVARGTEDTDAVNVQQLNKATSELNGKLSDVTSQVDGKINDATSRFDQKLNETTNRLERRVNDVEDDANSGIAAAMAVATLGQAYERGQKSVSMGGSVWRGETGYAVGVSTVSEEGSWLFKANGAVSSKGYSGGGVSATYLWH